MPFRTSPDMAGAVMRGDVDVAFEFYAALSGLLADNKIVALASTGAKRTAYLPDVPTVMESGIKDYDVASWNGLSVPAGTPKPVIATLNAAMKEVIPGPDVQGKSEPDGHGHALEHARRHDGADEGRHRQMGRGDREGRHSEAGLNRTVGLCRKAGLKGYRERGFRWQAANSRRRRAWPRRRHERDAQSAKIVGVALELPSATTSSAASVRSERRALPPKSPMTRIA